MIRRSARKQTYTTIDNRVFNAGLSFRAMGMLTFLLSKPDNWEVSPAHLIKVTEKSGNPTKRDAVRAILNELIGAGFVTRETHRDETGAFKGLGYTVHDEPQLAPVPETDNPAPESPEADNPEPDNPATAKPPQVNTEDKVNTEVEKNTNGSLFNEPPVTTQSGKCDLSFETAWKRYPKREGSNPKSKAYSAWKARLKAGATIAQLMNGLDRYVKYCLARGIVGTNYVMQASRFFGPGDEYLNDWHVSAGTAKASPAAPLPTSYEGTETPDDQIPDFMK